MIIKCNIFIRIRKTLETASDQVLESPIESMYIKIYKKYHYIGLRNEYQEAIKPSYFIYGPVMFCPSLFAYYT